VNGIAEIQDPDDADGWSGPTPETAGWPAKDETSAELRHEATAQRAAPSWAADEPQLREWIVRVMDHDQDALAALYEALIGQVYGLALRITRRAPLAEEVAQDTFWQVWRQAPRFDPERGTVLAWIMTIARSRALDALRRINAHECEIETETFAELESGSGDGPPDLLAAVQQGHRLHAALASLDPVPRQLVSLAFLRGLSHDEIALYAGLPLGTVKSHIRRALAALRKKLQPDVDASDAND
jgi:RNA polymerase sigma-70 factor (ECF subfamily)